MSLEDYLLIPAVSFFNDSATAAKVVRHILNDLERFGAKPIDFKAFLDIMTAKMGERDTKEEAVGKTRQKRHLVTID